MTVPLTLSPALYFAINCSIIVVAEEKQGGGSEEIAEGALFAFLFLRVNLITY